MLFNSLYAPVRLIFGPKRKCAKEVTIMDQCE